LIGNSGTSQPEFKKHVLEVLRQPLEDGKVTISRALISITYPSRISGPLMDRIDLHIEVPAVKHRDLADRADGESSAAIA